MPSGSWGVFLSVLMASSVALPKATAHVATSQIAPEFPGEVPDRISAMRVAEWQVEYLIA